MNVTTEYGLYDNPRVQSDLEIDGFLRVLDEIQGLAHIGWVNKFEPVFRLENDGSLTSVQTVIETAFSNGEFDSAGLRAYVVSSDCDAPVSLPSDAIIVVKVENWWSSCLPNHLTERPEIMRYIDEREVEIESKLTEFVGALSVVHSEHADIIVTGGSQLSEGYGQYQFLAVR